MAGLWPFMSEVLMCRFLVWRTRLGEREQARMCQAFLGSTLIKLDPIVRVGSAAIRGGDREARVVGTTSSQRASPARCLEARPWSKQRKPLR
ncbi:hypothetical protein Lpp43_04266 [Lacticaseibacillus paracasei subsp. paracasei Lpp43]|nr:hypothetical protein Lpp43_04266 [Lacticaseibacillus paracasei subsp. paracasei Lpp43]